MFASIVAGIACVAPLASIPQDTTPFTTIVRFQVTDTASLIEHPLGSALILQIRAVPSLGWTVAVVRRPARVSTRNLLYHSRTWHGPYPTDIFAWIHDRHYFPDERFLPVYGYSCELRIRLLNAETAGTGDEVRFAAGTVEVAWRRTSSRFRGGA